MQATKEPIRTKTNTVLEYYFLNVGELHSFRFVVVEIV